MAAGHMSGSPRRKAAPPAGGVPTGLCKYTDVAFQWRRLLGRSAAWAGKDGDMAALRAALDTRLWLPARAGDPCLSPLWQTHGDLGQPGFEMWVGHSSDTRMVLCLSLDSLNRMTERLFVQEKTSRVLALPAALVLSQKQCDELIRMERYVVATLAEMR